MGTKHVPMMQNAIALETLRFLFSILKRPANIAVAVALIGWFAMYYIFDAQVKRCIVEKELLWKAMQKQDSASVADRMKRVEEVSELRGKIMECQLTQQRLEIKIQSLEKSKR